mgnify:CR=1 FL=1
MMKWYLIVIDLIASSSTVAYAEAVYPNSPINKKLRINVIDTPMLEI